MKFIKVTSFDEPNRVFAINAAFIQYYYRDDKDAFTWIIFGVDQLKPAIKIKEHPTELERLIGGKHE